MIGIFRLKGLRCEQFILDLGRRLRHWSFPSKLSKFSPCEGCPAVRASSTRGCPCRQKSHGDESNISFGFVFGDKFERSLFFLYGLRASWRYAGGTKSSLELHTWQSKCWARRRRHSCRSQPGRLSLSKWTWTWRPCSPGEASPKSLQVGRPEICGIEAMFRCS